MAGGNGPPPKKASERRNRNPKQAGDWVQLPAEGRKGRIPALPKGFARSTQAWWKKIWRSPMATQWSEADIPALIELAMLRERLVEDGKISVAGEVRLRSDQFGLTPEGRQKRRWVITDEDAVRAGLETEDELAAKRDERRRRVQEQMKARKTTRRRTAPKK
jgi:hypothetical protein